MLEHQDGPLIVQSDMTVLLDYEHPMAEEARRKLILFAELVKRPGNWHTYKMSSLSLWNAASTGMDAASIIDSLKQYARYGLPGVLETNIRILMERYGKLRLEISEGKLLLYGEESLLHELAGHSVIAECLQERINGGTWEVSPEHRGQLKQELIRLGFPVIDLAGYHTGEALSVALRHVTKQGRSFMLRDYQHQAVNLFYKEGTIQGGSGVVVLPCGAGKTIVGIAALARLNSATLILTSNATSVQQWKEELLDKTTLLPSEVGEYTGSSKQVRPVTIATYQILTHRKSKKDSFSHMKLFSERDWGLIIYDEVHLLPAPVFRMTADIQATRRLGLTATLVREDGCEEDVFSLIGPKQFELQWKTVEAEGHIASVKCTEIRVPLDQGISELYHSSEKRSRARLAAENPGKVTVVRQLLERHQGTPTLIIGQYLDQLHALADSLAVPVITGELPQQERQSLYEQFKAGDVPVLAVSKVANFAVDLPDAAVAIQISGSYGSRQEEAQRIGRILRPKGGLNEAWFYTIVTDDTSETEYAARRQMFMLEQGYQYELEKR
ncbi:DEAD/DEAH box helicase [Paenibacillus glycanilyticus]|uniref:DNA repair helicase XPB n=1 Tax=Paenibacillus glycanilyticus TaxID=126569 RepID=UPI00203C32F6|nr:DNA repair helicase XPB [Paenibacillus glycanilyticus]MCM3626335.1 DEAD/DEAH box helicase [Paenibacillus glycanilyticus]